MSFKLLLPSILLSLVIGSKDEPAVRPRAA